MLTHSCGRKKWNENQIRRDDDDEIMKKENKYSEHESFQFVAQFSEWIK